MLRQLQQALPIEIVGLPEDVLDPGGTLAIRIVTAASQNQVELTAENDVVRGMSKRVTGMARVGPS
jgi:hypothetical protein